MPKIIYKIQSPDILFLVVLLAFKSADIIFHKFLERHSTLSEKNIFSRDSLNPFDPLNGQNPLSIMKNFCQYCLLVFGDQTSNAPDEGTKIHDIIVKCKISAIINKMALSVELSMEYKTQQARRDILNFQFMLT